MPISGPRRLIKNSVSSFSKSHRNMLWPLVKNVLPSKRTFPKKDPIASCKCLLDYLLIMLLAQRIHESVFEPPVNFIAHSHGCIPWPFIANHHFKCCQQLSWRFHISSLSGLYLNPHHGNGSSLIRTNNKIK